MDFTILNCLILISIIEENQIEELIEVKKRYNIKTPQLHAPILSIYESQNKPITERLVDLADFRKEIREREINCIIEWINYSKVAGIECIVVHPGGTKGYSNLSEYKKIEEYNIEAFKKIGEKCEKEGIKVAIENMGYQKIEELLDLVEKVGSEYIGICLDTSHANMSKVNIPEFIKLAGKRLIATHISDNLGEHDDHLLPFSGAIKWKEVIEAFNKIGYSGIFNFEIPGEVRCPIEVRDIKINYAYQIGQYLIGEGND